MQSRSSNHQIITQLWIDAILIHHKSHKLTDNNIWDLVTELTRAPAVTKLYHKCQNPLPAESLNCFSRFLTLRLNLEFSSHYYPATYSCVCCRVTVKITVLIMTSPYTLTMGFLLNCPCPFQSFLNTNMDRLCAYKRSVRFISFSTHSQYYSNTSTINKWTHVIVQAHFHNINCLAELTKCIFLVIEKEM